MIRYSINWFRYLLVYSATLGARRISGSAKMSDSSRLRVENSETTAPSSPAWNQCGVFGGNVYCSPGRRTISCQTLYVCSRPLGGRALGLGDASPGTYKYTSPHLQRKVSSLP